jgi:hypothetical protein
MPHVAVASRKPKPPAAKPAPPSDEGIYIFGGAAIAAALGCSLETFYYLKSQGVLDGVVFSLGHKTLAADRAKLQALPELLANKT